MTPIKVFLSVGRTSTEEQENFVKSIESFLRSNNVEPLTVGRNYFSSKQPLVAVVELMKECAGSIILAYERVYINEGVDRRGNPKESVFKDAKLPTIWNQIEASMAYVLGHPLLVMVEGGLRSEGLLERGYDWFVKEFDLSTSILEDPEFLGVFKDWQQRLQANVPSAEAAPAASGAFASPQAALVTPLMSTPPLGPPAPPPTPEITRERLSQLRQTLDQGISQDELRVICFDLAEDYENLPGESKSIKIMNLLLKLDRSKSVPKLIEVGRRIRSDIAW